MIHVAPGSIHLKSMADVEPLSLRAILQANDENATLNGIDDDPATLEQSITGPTTNEVYDTTLSVIFGVNIEETNLLHTSTSRIRRNAGDVKNTKTSAVVGLIRFAVLDVLVMVDGFLTRFVVPSLCGELKGADVPNIGDREPIGRRATTAILIVLIIHK